MIELLVRMADDFTPEELREYSEELHLLKINLTESDADIDEETFWRNKRRFIYMPLVIPIEQCAPFSKYDDKHTVISYGEASLIAKIKFEQFSAIYESITGLKIRKVEEFKFEDQPAKRK